MKNYTTTIVRVLNEWLVEKGWDVADLVMCHPSSTYRTYVYIRGRATRALDVEFSQSELDGVRNRPPFKLAPSERLRFSIRAKLEKEVGK